MSGMEPLAGDPHRRWDGQRWLRWTGSEWVPENADDPAAAPSSRVATRNTALRRRWIIVVASVVVVATVVGVLLSARGKSAPRASNTSDAAGAGPSQVAYPTRAATCALETNVSMDVTSNGGEPYQAIGAASPVYNLSAEVLAQFEQLLSQVGSNDAETQIIPIIQKACDQIGDPILTKGQVTGLVQLAPSSDADSLGMVTLFATGEDGK